MCVLCVRPCAGFHEHSLNHHIIPWDDILLGNDLGLKKTAGRIENEIIGWRWFKHPSLSGKVWYLGGQYQAIRMQSTFSVCLLWKWGVVLGTCRFTQSGPRPLKFMISGGYKSMVICTKCWGNTRKNTWIFLDNSKMHDWFYRLV